MTILKRQKRDLEKIREEIEQSKSIIPDPSSIIPNLEEARKKPDTFVIFEGDYGGVVYSIIPVSLVKGSDSDLEQALNILGKGEEGNAVLFRILSEDDSISGWSISGVIEEGWWIHPDYERYREKVESILF